MKMLRVAALCLAISLVLSVAACGAPTGPETTPTPAATVPPSPTADPLEPKSKKIVTWLWNIESYLFKVDEFVRNNPGFEVDTSVGISGVWDDHSTDMPRLAAAIASGTGPDLVLGWNNIEAYYTDLFQPIQRFFDLDPDMDPEDFDANAFTLGTFSDQIFFMPDNYQAHMFAWSKDLFEKAGMDPDVPPATWSEYLDFARRATIKRPSGRIDSIGAEQRTFPLDMWHIVAYGETFVDRTGLKFNWNRPSYVELLEYARSIEDTYGGNELLGDTPYNFLFYKNVAMMPYIGGGGLQTIAEIWDTEIGFSRIPVPDGATERHTSYEVLLSYGIPKAASNPEGAWALLKSLSTEGVLALEARSYEANPVQYAPSYIFHTETRDRFYTSFESLLPEALMERAKVRDALMLEADSAYYRSPVHDAMIAYYYEQLTEFFAYRITAQDMVERMQSYSDSLIAEFIERKEAEGWTFDDEKGGIPPQAG